MASEICSLPAPTLYRSMMHNFHLISFPIYVVALVILFREKSKDFRTYKYYIIMHIFINIAGECYVSYLMLPVTYLPIRAIRTTGLMAQWGFSGMFQFHCLGQIIILTIGSILEMLYYRFKICIMIHDGRIYSTVLKCKMYLYRMSVFLNPLGVALTLQQSLEDVQNELDRLLQNDPTLPPELHCNSVVIAVFDANNYWIIVIFYIINTLLACCVGFGSFSYMIMYIRKSKILSKNTAKLQMTLIMSLFIQGAIHCTMIFAPVSVFVYALFFPFDSNKFALFLFLSISYHGFFSTCAMICFTKPLRDRILPCLNRKQIRVSMSSGP